MPHAHEVSITEWEPATRNRNIRQRDVGSYEGTTIHGDLVVYNSVVLIKRLCIPYTYNITYTDDTA